MSTKQKVGRLRRPNERGLLGALELEHACLLELKTKFEPVRGIGKYVKFRRIRFQPILTFVSTFKIVFSFLIFSNFTFFHIFPLISLRIASECSMGHSELRRNIELAVTEVAKKRAEQNIKNGITNQAFQQTKSNAIKFQQTTKLNFQTRNSNIRKFGRANTFSHFMEPSAPTIQGGFLKCQI